MLALALGLESTFIKVLIFNYLNVYTSIFFRSTDPDKDSAALGKKDFFSYLKAQCEQNIFC